MRIEQLLPIGVGGDIGVYGMLRAFHERYSVPSIALSAVATRAMERSAFVTNRVVPQIDQPDVMVDALRSLAKENPGKALVLLTNADWFVRTVVSRSADLTDRFVLPYPSQEAFGAVSSKKRFAEVCSALGIATPRTVALDMTKMAKDGAGTVDIPFPVIAKPADSAEYHDVEFPGQRKVYFLSTAQELEDLIQRLTAARFGGTFLIQEFIPGDETHMRSITLYRDTRGRVTLASGGQVLLQEHTPGTLGVPAAILTQDLGAPIDAAVAILDKLDYSGFANFDLKMDARTGEPVFFEVNPRIGRNNYYVTAAGANIAAYLVEDHIARQEIAPVRTHHEMLYSVVPFRLLERYIDDPELLSRVLAAKARGDMVHPLRYRGDNGLRRRAIVAAMIQNQYRKFARHYPGRTESGF